ncbi:class I mannose-6-phosphate isomerase [Erythrobacter sp. WH158]|uniref:Class I mannose-6-phosphate isomerase n=2 Tax=Erythrobacter crassostreae TaxID=2828328 RepID=A0A9X1F2C0_9SPHN|nr:class I mannose-6-phosphate isomerase [Erythrobacter crassostrea]MBV7259020.1 class I mannose-6-phosphate isomerase [Erythrobacter crassostrea]
MVEKVWGRDQLPASFKAPSGERIGEIWFEPPAELPQLLVKYLFTSEKLSVQVHPGNHNALDGEAGKEECWFVLHADEGAKLAIGFDEELTSEQIERAARDGSIEGLLTWHDVKAGDVYYLPAGTVHAIGPGLSLVEVQQNSDTTFRLYDYGRPRELHLERALAVADGGPYPAEQMGTSTERGQTLVDGAHFRLDRIEGAPDDQIVSAYRAGLLVLPLEGTVRSIDRDAAACAGECLYAASIDALDFSEAGVTLLTRPAG